MQLNLCLREVKKLLSTHSNSFFPFIFDGEPRCRLQAIESISAHVFSLSSHDHHPTARATLKSNNFVFTFSLSSQLASFGSYLFSLVARDIHTYLVSFLLSWLITLLS